MDSGQESEVMIDTRIDFYLLLVRLGKNFDLMQKRMAVLQDEHIKLTGKEYEFQGELRNGMDSSDIEGDTGVESVGRVVGEEH